MKETRTLSADRIKQYRYFPIVVFGALMLIFSLFFTRLLIKMDDGNFLGIFSAPDFTYFGWLKERYLTWDGRTASEFCFALFLRHNIIWWKIFNAATIAYIACFWTKLSGCFRGGMPLKERQIFCCGAMFLMLVSCLNPSVFWFAGALTYLWPFSAMTMTVAPLLFYVLEGKLNRKLLLLAVPAALLGASQEQSAACCTALYVILLISLFAKKLPFKVSLLLPAVPMLAGDYLLLSSPGAALRMESELSGFERFAEMSVTDKLFCGLSNFFANSYYLSNFLIILFIALLSALIFDMAENKRKAKGLLIAANAFSCAVCVALNYSAAALGGGLAHMIVRAAFKDGEFTVSFYLLIAFGCALTLLIAAMLAFLLFRNKKIGLPVVLCVAAGFCSAMVLGFSSSIFNSGQRAYFFTNMFVITACVIIFSSLRQTRLTSFLYKVSLFYAAATFAVDCVAFRLAELPLMG